MLEMACEYTRFVNYNGLQILQRVFFDVLCNAILLCARSRSSDTAHAGLSHRDILRFVVYVVIILLSSARKLENSRNGFCALSALVHICTRPDTTNIIQKSHGLLIDSHPLPSVWLPAKTSPNKQWYSRFPCWGPARCQRVWRRLLVHQGRNLPSMIVNALVGEHSMMSIRVDTRRN
jgi:hypothetical protein